MTSDPKVDRRTLLASGLAAGGALALGGPAAVYGQSKRIRPEPVLRSGAFNHGVAAGIPGQREITLWTRVDEIERSGRVILEVAREPDFRRTVLRREVRAAAIRDFTARATVSGSVLQPGEQYFYRFATRNESSPVGRFRTARPADSREPVRIGYFSCQDYQAGFYTAHQGLAAEEDLDLVVCLGDYIYERTFYEGPADRRDTTGANRDADVQTLREYRDKYALYRSDPDLQAMHAAHPFVAVVDDHEIEDNWAAGEPGSATPPAQRRVAFLERRRQGFLAFFEWMPRFRFRPDLSRMYGSIPLGANAELFLLDTRQFRDDQPCGDVIIRPCPDAETPGRTLLGPAQKSWFTSAVPASRARWKIVGNQIMIMSLDSAPGVTLNVDQWDGYGAERREVLEALRAAGVQDLSFLTGDIHTFFAGTVHTGGRVTTPAIGTEFVGGSITSLGLEDTFGPGTAVTEPGVSANNPHITFSNMRDRGYGVVEARPDELRVQFKSPSTTMTRDGATVRTLASFRVPAGTPRVERV